VARSYLRVYTEPDAHSKRLSKVERDTLLQIYGSVIVPTGTGNPRWYKLKDGFINSAYIQPINQPQLNNPIPAMPKEGFLGEVTVPFTQTTYHSRKGQWMPMYRLYYGSLHWVTDLVESPEGKPWYQITDEWLRVNYFVAATHLRTVSPSEVSPLSDRIPPEEKRIEVYLADQTLLAYEGEKQVLQAPISSGRKYMKTPQGEFQIDRKYPSKHMGNGGLTSDLNAYELVGVPWASFFHPSGIAFHGTFWHDNYGTPTSHGCVNLRIEDARWLFRWSTPVVNPELHYRSSRKITGKGTRVLVLP
jgi:hypothetical protein